MNCTANRLTDFYVIGAFDLNSEYSLVPKKNFFHASL